MEITRTNIIQSLRTCAKGEYCKECVYYDDMYKMAADGIGCREELMRTAARMLEEIGKGELPRKPVVAEKENPTVRHYRAMGRADLLAHAVGYSFTPPHDFCPATDEQREEEVTYFEAISDAAITVLKLKAREKE